MQNDAAEWADLPPKGWTAILADGEAPSAEEALRALCAADALVACDGAYAKARRLGRAPDAVVGDGDSLAAADRAALGARFVPLAEQDTNDLDKAFQWARAQGARRFAFFGLTGGREDHTLGNLFRLPAFAAEADDVVAYTNTGRFDVVRANERRVMASCAGMPVSVFAPEPGTRAASEGLQWPLAGVDLSPLWRGTLNRAVGPSFALASNRPLLVYRAWAGDRSERAAD